MEQAGRIPPMMELAPLARAFTRAENPLYFVGGSVRNALVGLPYDDLDVTCLLYTSPSSASSMRWKA